MLCTYKTTTDAFLYMADAFQRQILYTDTLIEQGNIYFEHLENGTPPVINFSYETVIDGRTLENPVNYALARVTPLSEADKTVDETARPVVIIDPRSGYGPGISGMREESETGVALKKNHPVYFIFFYPEPEPNQDVPDVIDTQILFLEKIKALHPKAPSPSIIANCQAGWAIMLIAAISPESVGPIVLNGSPISYWAGKDIEYPMRFKAGLVGGLWMVSFWSDLGNGIFDGANLVKGFEDLDITGTYWEKPYSLYANIDTERKEYLDFQRWWNGYYYMTGEEIKFITEKLFIRNQLEKGEITLNDEAPINLRNIKSPLMIFCSKGDSVSPPQQALNWIVKVWQSDQVLKDHNQIIIYLVHESVEHIDMFISGDVAVKEHDQLLQSVEFIEYLSPGLYEMKIGLSGRDKEAVSFEKRSIDDILSYDDGLEDEEDFEPASTLSTLNQMMYKEFVRPFVQFAINEPVAEMIRLMHPLRLPRYFFSDLNPLSVPIKTMTPYIMENRMALSDNNTFSEMEYQASEIVSSVLSFIRDLSDKSDTLKFKLLYGHPMVKALFTFETDPAALPDKDRRQKRPTPQDPASGNAIDGLLRILLLASGSTVNREILEIIAELMQKDGRFRRKEDFNFKKRIQIQADIVTADKNTAVESLTQILSTPDERQLGLAIAERITPMGDPDDTARLAMLKKIKKHLQSAIGKKGN